MFADINERPIPSLLRGFSAPIRLESDLADSDLFFLLAHDSDEFNRFVLTSTRFFDFFIYRSFALPIDGGALPLLFLC